ncbi:MAG: TIGR02996 domain-containing protein [Myxococcota bacterium]
MPTRMKDLVLALDWWRATREPGLADVVRALSRPPHRGPPNGANAYERDADWLSVASRDDPQEVSWLLEHLVVASSVDRSTARLEHLGARGPDPRVADAAMDWVVAGHFRSMRQHAWWQRVEHVIRSWGPRDFDFRALSHRVRAGSSESMLRLAGVVQGWTTLAPPVLPLSTEQATVFETWRPLLPKPRREVPPDLTHAELWQAVLATPNADAPRAVLADYLLARGRPQGRFIRLQLERSAHHGPIDESRSMLPHEERVLLEAHEGAWFGVAFPALVEGAPERGFYRHIQLGRKAEHLAELAEAQGLSTVRHIRLDRTAIRSKRQLATMLRSPHLSALQRVNDLSMGDLAAFKDGVARPSWLSAFPPANRLEALAKAVEDVPWLQRLEISTCPPHPPDALGAFAVPELSLPVAQWLGSQWVDEIGALIARVGSSVQRLVFAGAHEGLSLLRDDEGIWTVDLGPHAREPKAPRDATYLSLPLIWALRDRPRRVVDGPGYAYIPHVEGDQFAMLEQLPPRPVFIGGGYPHDRARWLRHLPPLDEVRLFVDSHRWIRAFDGAPRIKRIQLLHHEGSLGPLLWRGDDGALRYAWASGLTPEQLHPLSKVLNRKLTLAAPP